jgi:mRNA-degrading endonuclease toxin of MazEF toxin-antitoxin module
MPITLKKTKGTYGVQQAVYRHLDGTTMPARIISAAAMSVPGTPTITVVGATGAANYGYRVSAITQNGETTAGTGATTATGNATLDATNYNRVSWSAVAGATGYRGYGRTGGT